MKLWALEYLLCPETGSPVELRDAVCEDGEVMAGSLRGASGREYPIRRGVPDLTLQPVSSAEDQTVAAFGEEWDIFDYREGFVASRELFFTFFPVLQRDDFPGRVVLDAGCGNGRWLGRMAEMGSRRVIGMDYSCSVHNSWLNTRHLPNVTVVQGSILQPPLRPGVFDLIASMGVIHHLDDPVRGMRELGTLLRPQGKIAVWLYGQEGNELYLSMVRPLRKLCPHLPTKLLLLLSRMLAVPVWAHAHATNRWWGTRRDGTGRLPMAGYFDFLSNLTFDDVVSTVYDQLTPQLARYYRRDEVDALFADARLTLTACDTPRGNSYSVAGTRAISGAKSECCGRKVA
ncbi:MAG: methyltransferase domain-containing protein [Candidatus Nealsonbacteria bacterium]|nr:methyltransferase domain-containing protein [Candidatus Nealsonbacteria bacterium]